MEKAEEVKRVSLSDGMFELPKKYANRPRIKRKRSSTPAQIGWKGWAQKYFWEGQSLSSQFNIATLQEEKIYSDAGSRFLSKYRRPLALFIPAFIIHFFWWCIMINYNFFHLFKQKYIMTITMVFGSIFAGMTSEGGGAVAFPVMTLLLGVKPTAARDFSMLIQSVGMTAAMFTILFMQVQIEWHAIILGSLGAVIGLIVGLEYVDEFKYPAWKKMCFVSVWFSFAFALFLLNRYHKRKTYRIIPNFSWWKALVLIFAGALGGAFTSFAGSGVDMCMFSFLTLFFRVTEKTATPTSVIMMAIISIMGAFWRTIIIADVEVDTFEYLAVCVPVVVLGAPVGSVLGSHFHRQVLAQLVYILDTVALITAFMLVKQTLLLAGVSVAIIVVGFCLFGLLAVLGNILMERQTKQMGDSEQRTSSDDEKSEEVEEEEGEDEKYESDKSYEENDEESKNSSRDETQEGNDEKEKNGNISEDGYESNVEAAPSEENCIDNQGFVGDEAIDTRL